MPDQQPLCGTFAPRDWRRYIGHPSTPDIERWAVLPTVELEHLRDTLKTEALAALNAMDNEAQRGRRVLEAGEPTMVALHRFDAVRDLLAARRGGR